MTGEDSTLTRGRKSRRTRARKSTEQAPQQMWDLLRLTRTHLLAVLVTQKLVTELFGDILLDEASRWSNMDVHVEKEAADHHRLVTVNLRLYPDREVSAFYSFDTVVPQGAKFGFHIQLRPWPSREVRGSGSQLPNGMIVIHNGERGNPLKSPTSP